MTVWIKQSTTQLPLRFLLVQPSDHITGATGLTPTVTISKAGGAFASPSGAVSEISNGWYKIAANATDTNTLGSIDIHVASSASNDPCDVLDAAFVVAMDPTATSFGLSLAKTTNITGFNDITAAAAATGVWQDTTSGDFTVASSIGKSLYTSGNAPGAASGLALVGSNMGTITGALTAAQIATGVWQDTTAGDFTVASSIGKSLYTSGNAPGAASGLLIAGSNAATTFATLTVSGATTFTGNVSAAAGVTITQSTTNGTGLSITGNGTGAGISATGGATGPGAKFVGGGTSGDGIDITTTSGDGLSILPTAGNGIIVTANGTSKHGMVSTGGTAGTSDGIKAVAGTGGVDLRANITGNVTGNLSGSAGSVTGAVGSVTGNVGGNVVGSVASVTGNVGGNVVGSVASVASGGISRASFTADSGLQSVRSNTAQAGAASTITLDASASATNSFYNGCLIYLTGGTGVGQAAYITGYVGATKVATIEGTWVTNPDSSSTFAILANNQVVVGTNNDKTGYALSATGFNTYADAASFANGLTYRQTLNGIFLCLPLSKRSGLTNDGSAASIVVRDVADTKNAITVGTDGHGNISTTPTFNL